MTPARIVLTGAAGRLGSYLREPLTRLCDTLVSTDIVDDIGTRYPGEEYVRADLAELEPMIELAKGADVIVHFGAIVDEAPFETLLGPNFVGSHNVWEAAHRNGVRRVVYASSIHAVGMYSKHETLGVDVAHRPDTYYGLAKCFTEDLARMCWEKRGIEAVCLRIASCAQVTSARALGTWLSYDDLIRLVTRSIDTPTVGFTIAYGVSANDRAALDNTGAAHLGYRPRDNAEVFAEEILASTPPLGPHDPEHTRHGGPFAKVALGESGLASMDIVDDRKRAGDGA